MSIEIQRDALLAALKAVVPATRTSGAKLPILETVHVQQDGGICRFTCNNLETEILVSVDTGSPKACAFTAPARKLLALSTALPSELLKLELRDSTVTLKAPVGRYRLSSLNEQDFPTLTMKEGDGRSVSLPLAGGVLHDAIARCRYAVATGDVRHTLNGMLFSVKGDRLTLVATDGHRLGSTCITTETKTGEDVQCILPSRALDMLCSMLPEDDSEVSVKLHERRSASFEFGDCRLTTLLVDGRYPDWMRVVPAHEADKAVEVDTAALSAAIKRVMALQPEATHPVLLEFDRDASSMKITGNNSSQEMGEEHLPCVFADGYTGGNRIGLNPRYLQDIVEVLPQGPARLQVRSEEETMRIESPADPDSVQVLMPMRI